MILHATYGSLQQTHNRIQYGRGFLPQWENQPANLYASDNRSSGRLRTPHRHYHNAKVRKRGKKRGHLAKAEETNKPTSLSPAWFSLMPSPFGTRRMDYRLTGCLRESREACILALTYVIAPSLIPSELSQDLRSDWLIMTLFSFCHHTKQYYKGKKLSLGRFRDGRMNPHSGCKTGKCLASNDVDQLADDVGGYNQFCKETYVPRVPVKIYPNNNPWVSKSIKSALNKKKEVFWRECRPIRKLKRQKLTIKRRWRRNLPLAVLNLLGGG